MFKIHKCNNAVYTLIANTLKGVSLFEGVNAEISLLPKEENPELLDIIVFVDDFTFPDSLDPHKTLLHRMREALQCVHPNAWIDEYCNYYTSDYDCIAIKDFAGFLLGEDENDINRFLSTSETQVFDYIIETDEEFSYATIYIAFASDIKHIQYNYWEEARKKAHKRFGEIDFSHDWYY